ncbi:hypothetical protein PIB30_058149 [Stylosanthes scabra]|uniref:Uncharacterized protein n=1 Tax=Stylosanthes scabra TaxID=79078 RepID=A0ABU6YLQ4_9FABA|nr:hypothetical protein [Stylosanthes scabra]
MYTKREEERNHLHTICVVLSSQTDARNPHFFLLRHSSSLLTVPPFPFASNSSTYLKKLLAYGKHRHQEWWWLGHKWRNTMKQISALHHHHSSNSVRRGLYCPRGATIDAAIVDQIRNFLSAIKTLPIKEQQASNFSFEDVSILVLLETHLPLTSITKSTKMAKISVLACMTLAKEELVLERNNTSMEQRQSPSMPVEHHFCFKKRTAGVVPAKALRRSDQKIINIRIK